MHLSQKQKLMVAIGIFMISGFILYLTFGKSSSEPGAIDVVASDGTVNPSENQDIIDLANKFDQISVNIDLFSSTLFKNLKDLETPLSSEDSGRPNPFANIGTDVVSAVTASPVSTTTAKKKTP